MKKLIKQSSKLLCFVLLIISIFGIVNVLAEENIFKITNISVKEKSNGVNVKDVSLSDGVINNNISFDNKDEYIKYDITLKNNTNSKYKILSISDDNDSEYLDYTYDDLSNIELNSGEEKTFNLTITYIKETSEITISDKDYNIVLSYEKEDGTTGTETITVKGNNKNNPTTGDNITIYIILGIISLFGLTITIVKRKNITKSIMILVLTSSIILPLGVKADSNKFFIKFKNTIKVTTYEISFKDGTNLINKVEVLKDEKVTRPDNPTKDHYDFINWYADSNLETEFDFENTTITKDTDIYARFKIKSYNVTFNTDGAPGITGQTVNYGEYATKPSEEPEKNGYVFDDWYTTNEYTTKFDFSNDSIKDNTTIYAKFIKLNVCNGNRNIVKLSSNTCSENENITVGSGIVCKRAIKLHTEKCTQTSTTNTCSADGYTLDGTRQTDVMKYGSCGTQGELNVGDAFTCDVNGDGEFNEITERFYYISDYYDTVNNTYDTSTASLIYYNNVSNGISCNYDLYAYSTTEDVREIDPSHPQTQSSNWHGPLTAVKHLPTTSQWTNVTLKNTERQILNEKGLKKASNKPLPLFSYNGRAARLLTYQELDTSCGLPGRKIKDECNFVYENTKYASDNIRNNGFYLEAAFSNDTSCVWAAYSKYLIYDYGYGSVDDYRASRPTIDVPKSKIAY